MTRPDLGSPIRMTADDLGNSLAQLVWESFTDFVADGDAEISLPELGVPTDEEGVPDHAATEEALIFLMWAHTRGAQLAFFGQNQDELVREGLDAMHRAVFEDMVEHGTPEGQLPLFEQRVSARYSEYYAAADVSDVEVGSTAVRHITGSQGADGQLAWAARDRAVAVTKPLRDFLEEVKLER